MTSASFPIAQGGDGISYSADGSGTRDMLNGGHRSWFIPALQQTIIMAESAAASAVAAAAGAAAMTGTSATSVTIGAGSKSFTASAGKSWIAGSLIAVVRTSAPTASQMFGAVTSYNSGTGALVVSVTDTLGSGTYTDWTIVPAGMRGAAGSGNSMTRLSVTAGGTTLGASDNGKFVDCSGASDYTLDLIAAASLGVGWWCIVRASGTAKVAIDPSGAETIDGAGTLDLYPGNGVLIQCDGLVLRTIGMPRRINSLPILGAAAAAATAVTPLGSLANSTFATGLSVSGGFAQNGTTFVAFDANGSSQANVASSTDGVTWVLRAMPTSAAWVVQAVGTGFIATDASGTTKAAYSAAGTSWANTGATLPGAMQTMIAGNGAAGLSGIFVVRGSASSTTLYKTVDNGANWTTETLPVAAPYLIGIGSVFVAWAAGSNTYYTSTTGATGSWTTRTLPGSRNTIVMDFDGSLLTCQTTDLTVTYQRSTDGIAWTDLAFVPPSASGTSTMNSIAGTYISFVSGSQCATKHAGEWVARESGVTGGNSLTRNITKKGNVHLAGSNFIDPTIASAKTSLFFG